MKTILFKIALLFPFLWVAQQGISQTTYIATNESYVIIEGTSTLHDWDMRSDDVKSKLVLNIEGDDEIESVELVSVVLEKSSLEAEQDRLERTAKEAMEAKEHPEISFRSQGEANVIVNGDEYRISAMGELTISGVTREVTVEATCIDNGEELVCAGTQDLRMTDFNIEPPRMFLGTLVTDDEVTVEYKVAYRPSEE